MKAVSFEFDGRETYGVSTEGGIREVEPSIREQYPTLRRLIAAGQLASLPSHCSGEPMDAGAMRYLPPVPRPGKILCVGVNYRPHVEEMGREIPDYPVLFVRFPDSLVGHAEALIRPRVSEQYDFEGEIAVVVGRRARHVARADAADYIAGYTGFMDGSVRDWQRHTMQFTAGKNFASSGAMGPYLVTADEIGDAGQLGLETRVNGNVMQTGRLDELIFSVAYLIEYISTFAALEPGDVIATGTPGGVGAARRPPVWLEPGDRVEVDIGPLGTLANTVRAE